MLFISFSCSFMKSIISLGIDTAYELPTYRSLTLNCFFLRFWKFSYSFKSSGWTIKFLHGSHFRVLSMKPFLVSCSGCIFLLQCLHRIVFSNMSCMCILSVYTLKTFL